MGRESKGRDIIRRWRYLMGCVSALLHYSLIPTPPTIPSQSNMCVFVTAAAAALTVAATVDVAIVVVVDVAVVLTVAPSLTNR